MSWEAVEAVLLHSRSKRDARLVLLVIAERADAVNRECFPSKADIARRANMNVQAAGRIVARLVAAGELVQQLRMAQSTRYIVTAGLTPFQIETAMLAAWGMTPAQLQAHNAATMERLTRTPTPLLAVGGANKDAPPTADSRPPLLPVEAPPLSAVSANQKITTNNPQEGPTAPPARINPPALVNPKTKPGTPPATPRQAPKRTRAAPDPRSKHPAVLLVKQITKRYPPAVWYGDLIAKLGDAPDVDKATNVYKTWVGRGFNPSAMTPFVEWYANGCPEFQKPGGGGGGYTATRGGDRPGRAPVTEYTPEQLADAERRADAVLAGINARRAAKAAAAASQGAGR